MNASSRAAVASLAAALALPVCAADAASAAVPRASAAAGSCAAPGPDRDANRVCAGALARRAETERAAGHTDAALAALARADQFAPDDLRFAMAHAGLALRSKNQFSPAGIESAARAAPDDVGLTLLQAEVAAAKRDYPAVLAATDRVLARRPDAALAWEMRATAHVARADFDGARVDVDQALRLDPKSPVTLRLRGVLRNNAGDHDGALADYQAAHAIAPRPEDPFVIGSTQFLQRQYAAAADSMAQRAPPAPEGIYWRLWRYMALARLDGVVRARGSLGPGTQPGPGEPWPGPVVDYFHGSIDSAALLAAARKAQAANNLSQVCEAHFYMGEDSLLHQRGDALALWRQAAQECPHNFHEYEGAVAELMAAGVAPAALASASAAPAALAPASAAPARLAPAVATPAASAASRSS